MKRIDLTFRYLEIDYVRALRAHYATRLRLRLDLACILVLFGMGIYLWRSPDLHWLAVTFVITSVGFALLIVTAFTIVPRRIFRSEPRFRDEYSLTFSEEGIHFRTAHIDSRLQWSIYSSALIDAHSYVLCWGSRQFTVIPKRVFKNAEQQQAFEQLLTQRVTDVIRRNGSS